MAYDRIDWHSGGEFPAGLPDNNGGTHIGMFLAWAFCRGMAGEFHREESAEMIKRLLRREITGLDFLIEACDEKFWDEDLNDQGNAFAADYYNKSAFATHHGSYLADYRDVFNRYAAEHGFEYPTVYHVENSWENFDRLKPMLDQRFDEWQAWSADPANSSLDPKTRVLQACQEIGKLLAPRGFKPNKAGTTWKKAAADKDTAFEVSFAPCRYNSRKDVRMTVHLDVTSKVLKKWVAERNRNYALFLFDSILSGSLRRPHKSSDIIEWQVAGLQRRSSLQGICQSLEEHALPFFELFADRPNAIEHLTTHGGEFPGIRDADARPLPFILCFGTREQAQCFFTNYVKSTPWRGKIARTFKRLREGETWDSSSYFEEEYVKLAFQSGLVLPEKA